MTRDNAARSILDVLEFLQLRPNQTLAGCWSAMLSLDTVDRPSVLRGVATIAELPDRAIEQVHSIEGVDHEHLLEWEGPVRGGFAQAYVLANPAQTVTAHVTDVALFALRGCARAIDRAPQGREVDDDGIEAARQNVRDLIDSLEAAELDDDVKATLLRHASAIGHALNTVRYTGARDVDDALAAALGSAFFAARTHPGVATSPAFANFLRVIELVAAVVTVWTGTAQITAGVVDVLSQIRL